MYDTQMIWIPIVSTIGLVCLIICGFACCTDHAPVIFNPICTMFQRCINTCYCFCCKSYIEINEKKIIV